MKIDTKAELDEALARATVAATESLLALNDVARKLALAFKAVGSATAGMKREMESVPAAEVKDPR